MPDHVRRMIAIPPKYAVSQVVRGMIALDANGKLATPYSTPRMAHGYVRGDERAVIVLND